MEAAGRAAGRPIGLKGSNEVHPRPDAFSSLAAAVPCQFVTAGAQGRAREAADQAPGNVVESDLDGPRGRLTHDEADRRARTLGIWIASGELRSARPRRPAPRQGRGEVLPGEDHVLIRPGAAVGPDDAGEVAPCRVEAEPRSGGCGVDLDVVVVTHVDRIDVGIVAYGRDHPGIRARSRVTDSLVRAEGQASVHRARAVEVDQEIA